MTKNQFITFAKQHNVSCRYSGNTKTMYLTGSTNDTDALIGHLVGVKLNFFYSIN